MSCDIKNISWPRQKKTRVQQEVKSFHHERQIQSWIHIFLHKHFLFQEKHRLFYKNISTDSIVETSSSEKHSRHALYLNICWKGPPSSPFHQRLSVLLKTLGSFTRLYLKTRLAGERRRAGRVRVSPVPRRALRQTRVRRRGRVLCRLVITNELWGCDIASAACTDTDGPDLFMRFQIIQIQAFLFQDRNVQNW